MKIGLGTANFGNSYGLSFKENINKNNDLNNLLKAAKKFNINILDTSYDYKVKKNLIDYKKYKNFDVISKLRFSEKEKKNKNLEKIFLKKIIDMKKKYQIKNFYAILFHRSEDINILKKKKLNEIIKYLKDRNICNKFGVSIYDPSEIIKIQKKWKPDIIQLPINVLDNRIVDSGWIKKLHNSGVEIHARSIFLQSLLLMESDKIPKKFYQYKSILRKFENYCKIKNVSKLDMCINHMKKFKQISHVVVGVQSVDQLKKINFSFKKKLFKCDFKIPNINKKLIDPRLW